MPHEIHVPAPPDQAFATFNEGMSNWWQTEYTRALRTLDKITNDPREGGH